MVSVVARYSRAYSPVHPDLLCPNWVNELQAGGNLVAVGEQIHIQTHMLTCFKYM